MTILSEDQCAEIRARVAEAEGGVCYINETLITSNPNAVERYCRTGNPDAEPDIDALLASHEELRALSKRPSAQECKKNEKREELMEHLFDWCCHEPHGPERNGEIAEYVKEITALDAQWEVDNEHL